MPVTDYNEAIYAGLETGKRNTGTRTLRDVKKCVSLIRFWG